MDQEVAAERRQQSKSAYDGVSRRLRAATEGLVHSGRSRHRDRPKEETVGRLGSRNGAERDDRFSRRHVVVSSSSSPPGLLLRNGNASAVPSRTLEPWNWECVGAVLSKTHPPVRRVTHSLAIVTLFVTANCYPLCVCV